VIIVHGAVAGGNISSSIGAALQIEGALTDGEPASIVGGIGSALTITSGRLIVRQLRLTASVQPALFVEGAETTVELSDVLVESNPGGGILINSGKLSARRVTIQNNGKTRTDGTSWSGVRLRGGTSDFNGVRIIGNSGAGLVCDRDDVFRPDRRGYVGVDVTPKNADFDLDSRCGAVTCQERCKLSATPDSGYTYEYCMGWCTASPDFVGAFIPPTND
jgi:hypothetical protein